MHCLGMLISDMCPGRLKQLVLALVASKTRESKPIAIGWWLASMVSKTDCHLTDTMEDARKKDLLLSAHSSQDALGT